MSVLIPPLTLQPIVENAYIHGLSVKEEGGKISVEVIFGEDKVIATIEDSGVGMSEEQIHRIYDSVNREHKPERTKSSNGIGMANVIERLELFYKSSHIMEIYSEEGMGTSIRLMIPVAEGVTND